MKLLLETDDEQRIAEITALLESKGILVFVGGEGTSAVSESTSGSRKGLWVYLDEQESDARALLENPSHVVENPVDISESREDVNHENTIQPKKSAQRAAQITIAVFALVFGLWLISKMFFA